MPTKIGVAQLMDHGIGAASTAALSPAASVAAVSVLLPAEADAQVLKTAKLVSLREGRLAAVAKIIAGVRTTAQFAAAMIKGRYDLLGGAGGFLGAAQTSVTVCPDGVGYFQHYQGGSIYYHPYAGAHEVHGAIRAKWAAMGWERSFLGYPRTDETAGRDTRSEGRYNHFQGGSIYWHPATNAHEVHGAIRAKYLELGAEAGFLGYPTTDETGTPDGVGRFNHFQAGSIYWTPRTAAHEVHGLIRGFWAERGWERNPELGYPISDELIPHRGIGFTRPPFLRKPLLEQPLDVIRLPDEQPSPTIAVAAAALRASATAGIASVPPAPAPAPSPVPVTMSPRISALGTMALRTTSVATFATAPSTASTAVSRFNPALLGDVILRPPISINPVANHKGQSQDRYGDFENGVLFWKRGSSAAIALAPRAQAPNGARMAWTGPEIAALAAPRIRQALAGFPGAAVMGVNFVGTASYWFDGAGVHNRPHRLQVILQGQRSLMGMLMPSLATVEVQVEISFDPVDREIVGFLANWTLAASQGDFLGGGSLGQALHQRLDPALWREFLVTVVPGTADDPIAVLSVKTQADGDVVVYFEP